MRVGYLGLGVALLALAGCGGGRNKGGVFASHRGTPNELAVGRAAPLTVPPDFALVPPRPGQPRPQEADSSTQALNALFGGEQRASQGEQILTREAGAGATPGIRSDVGNETPTVVNKGQTTQRILQAPPSSNPQANAATTPVGGVAGDSGAPGTAPAGAATNPPGTPTDNPGR